VQNQSRVHFSLPITAGRPVGGEGLVFSQEEILAGDVTRVGPAMVRWPGIGSLHLGFEFPVDEPLAGNPVFRAFAKKLIRSIPSPFFALSLENDSLKLLFLSTLDNLEIQWRAADEQVRICANAGEYSALFAEEISRLKAVLAANGSDEVELRIGESGEYFTK
jgi:hypothetical protein